ncbi:MAG: DUF2914 domain-containing protein [Candidatus Binatota bacterium]|nr:DUF2914 domain-containing protein [Candidatus Binatota bacterium]
MPVAQAESPPASWFQRHKDKLWWLHSAYALLLGVGIMWLGARNYNFLRVTVFHVGFIWLSSLYLPRLLNQTWLSPRWAERLRLLVNFFNKNLYQQVLFFILPIYFGSATLSSVNVLFVVLLAISALLSTLDVVYDRHLSVRRGLTALFFAFNLFALLNVMLPVLWSIGNNWATRVSALLAALGFATILRPFAQLPRWQRAFAGSAVVLLVALVEFARPFIPPAPLRLGAGQFGSDYHAESKSVEPVLTEAQAGQARRIHVITPIKAPLGLKETVEHRWYQNGKLVWASPFIEVTGGREQGFRLWTNHLFDVVEPGAVVRVDAVTEGGQLIGRAHLPVGK